MVSPLHSVASEADTPMQPEFSQPHERPPNFQMGQLLLLLSNAMLQINQTNQAMLSFLSANGERLKIGKMPRFARSPSAACPLRMY